MPKFSDTQLLVLAIACGRPERMVLPLPDRLRGGSAKKVVDSLLAKGLIAEIDASAFKDAPIWRRNEAGLDVTLIATEAAEAVIKERGEADAATIANGSRNPTATTDSTDQTGSEPEGITIKSASQKPARRSATTKRPAPDRKPKAKTKKEKQSETEMALPKRRDGTKQSQLVALLKRAKGASINEMAQAFGWQPHTVRGALAGSLKKKLGLTIVSEKEERRGRIYRIAAYLIHSIFTLSRWQATGGSIVPEPRTGPGGTDDVGYLKPSFAFRRAFLRVL